MGAKHLSDKDADRAAAFMAEVASVLGLPQWSIRVMEKPCEKDAQATVGVIHGRYVAEVRLSRGWTHVHPDEQRNTLVHEVLHLFHHRIDDVVLAAESAVPKKALRRLHDGLNVELEYMVDLLTTVVQDMPAVRSAWHRHYS
ncbi:hypothetical protein HMPREF0569_1593 [Micrococcus luteus SK58]|uniref:hypothetical protein n=1 Tax=Micrococcus luteus TaxID=1270 RepID=UPI0001C4FFE7|nr:hypothetical protein [Micrococcus luteus]EFD50340.1 hypothetical protein HMPREF0569_1593 [Micrococcus luteus SK58]